MRKWIVCMLLCVVSASGVYAQFEQKKWFVNPSITGLDLSYDQYSKAHFGLQVNGGAFVIDNLAVLLGYDGSYTKDASLTSLGTGVRYYMDKVGVYVGAGLKYSHYSVSDVSWNYALASLECGYAYFLSRTVTIEPALYYNLSLSDDVKLNRFGVKIGFGIYF